MTRREFVDNHRHEFSGMVLDAAITKATGAPLAVFLRDMMKRVDERLGQMYDELIPPAKTTTLVPAVNGKETVKR